MEEVEMTAARKVLAEVETSPFDAAEFRRLAREVLDKSASPDPKDSADDLLGLLTDQQCRVALATVLPGWLRNLAGTTDRHTRMGVAVMAEAAAPAKPRVLRNQRIGSWWQDTLKTRLFTGEGDKFLRDCTAVDLRGAAEVRFKAALATQTEGERYARLAAILDEGGYATVSEVPEATLKAVFS